MLGAAPGVKPGVIPGVELNGAPGVARSVGGCVVPGVAPAVPGVAPVVPGVAPGLGFAAAACAGAKTNCHSAYFALPSSDASRTENPEVLSGAASERLWTPAGVGVNGKQYPIPGGLMPCPGCWFSSYSAL